MARQKKIFSQLLEPIFETPEGLGNWFGYYNYDPLSYDQTKMLCNRTKNDACEIKKGMAIELGYYDIPSGVWHHIGKTDSYNWQQGAMMQWIPGKGNENKVIYNCSRNNHLISRIHDIKTGEDRELDWSIYGLTPDGKKSIALNMERSYWCRAYHYVSVANEEYNVRVPEDDGIFEIDLFNNTRRRIIDIADVIAIDKEPYFDNAKHWLEHIMISPSGKRFCFLHRFTVGDLNDYETRLFIADIDGSHLQIVADWRKYYLSHFGWDGDDAFSIYSYESPIHAKVLRSLNSVKTSRVAVKSMIKGLYYKIPKPIRQFIFSIRSCGDQEQTTYYQYFSLSGDLFKLSSIFKNKEFDIDGHPSFTNDGMYMITDSYPDKNKYRRLLIYNKEKGVATYLGRLNFSGYENYDSDLHPKLSKNNDYLMIDTSYNGKHHMILFKLKWDEIINFFSNI